MGKLLEDLAEWVISENIAVTVGTDIFLDFTPAQPAAVMVLKEYDSILSPWKGNPVAVRYVQVLSRSTVPSEAKSKIDDLFNLFMDSEEEFTIIPSGRTFIISPKQAPRKLAIDEEERHIFGFNMAITTNTD